MKKFLSLIVLLISFNVFAQTDPYKQVPKTVQFIMPYAQGGIVDIQFRAFQRWMEDRGVSVIGMNRPGGNSVIGAQELLNGPRDGSMLMMNSTSNSWYAEQRIGKKVIEPITTTGGNANAIITQPGSKYEKYEDFVKAVKAGDPELKVGWHAVANLINIKQFSEKVNGQPITTIPYKTSTDSSRDVAGGHLPVAFVPMSTARPLVESGKVKIIFGFAAGDLPLPPDVLDLKKRIPSWRHAELFFVGVAPGTDEKMFKAWAAIWKEFLNDKEVSKYLADNHLHKEVGGPAFVQDTIKHQAEMLERYKITIN